MNNPFCVLDFLLTVTSDDGQFLATGYGSSLTNPAQLPLSGAVVFHVPANLNQLLDGYEGVDGLFLVMTSVFTKTTFL